MPLLVGGITLLFFFVNVLREDVGFVDEEQETKKVDESIDAVNTTFEASLRM